MASWSTLFVLLVVVGAPLDRPGRGRRPEASALPDRRAEGSGPIGGARSAPLENVKKIVTHR
jgi:hypothetical protein